MNRIAKDRRERGNVESVRGTRWNRKLRRMRSDSMASSKNAVFQLRLKARLISFVHASNRNQPQADTRPSSTQASYPMADRARRDRQTKSDKLAAYRLARQGGRREWKVRCSRIRVGSRHLHAANPSVCIHREKRQSYMTRSRRINTRASSKVV